MKMAVSNIAWSKEEDEQILQLFREFNLEGLELAPPMFGLGPAGGNLGHDEVIARIASFANRFGVGVVALQGVCFGVGGNMFSSDDDGLAVRRQIRASVKIAGALGCPLIVLGCPRNRILPAYDRANERAAEVMLDLAKVATSEGVQIALEHVPRLYGGNFLESLEEVRNFLEWVSSPALRVNLDLGSLSIENAGIESLSSAAPLVAHVHLSEPDLVEVKWSKSHDSALSVLARHDYSGFVSIEMRPRGVEALRRALRVQARLMSA